MQDTGNLQKGISKEYFITKIFITKIKVNSDDSNLLACSITVRESNKSFGGTCALINK